MTTPAPGRLLPALLAGLAVAISGVGNAWAQPRPSAEAAAREAQSASVPTGEALKVCSDAHNLPQSDDKGQGYENKIAEALAHDLKKKLAYTYFPQRMGFVRNTLRAQDAITHAYKCDVIIGVPKGYDQTATTRPYMHSTYAIVVPANGAFRNFKRAAQVLSLPPQKLKELKFGIFAQTPAADWLLKNGLLDRAALYQIQSGDPRQNPQSIVGADLTADRIDAAIVWGPVAGFLVNSHSGGTPWKVLPFDPDPTIRFDYEMSMGVRFGETQWKNTLDAWIASHHEEINRILTAYHIPLLDDQGRILNARN